MANRQGGVTLIELIVTCTLLTLLSGLAIPGATRWLAETRAERTLHRLNAALSYARLIAVTERTAVVLCPLEAGGRCGGDWNTGFTVFRDAQRRARLDAGTQPLRVFPGGDTRVVLRAFRTRRYFRFLPNGQTDWQNGRFLVCSGRPDVAIRGLVLNVQGRGRIVREVDDRGACARND